jgi:hypothetical protein
VEIMGDLPAALNRLATRLENLELRVQALEHPSEASCSLPELETNALQEAEPAEALPFAQAGGAFSVLGKAMLGIAGAYVLRAVAESTPLPKLAIAAVAIVYAMMWLVWAARVKGGQWFASAIYAGTSALILASLLWELTLSFKVLPAPWSACILGAFVLLATALAWKQNLTPLLWVANVTAAGAAIVLSIATLQMVPFIAVLLVMVLVCEFAAARNRELSIRVMVAAAADLALWALVFIYSSPQSTRQDYPSLGAATLLVPGFALLLIFGSSVVFRTVLNEKKISVFETLQIMIVFLLAACSLLFFAPGAGATVLAALCLALSAAGYTAAFTVFDRAVEKRNYHVFSTWSAGLLLACGLLWLPPFWLTTSLGMAAIAAAVLGVARNRLALEIHGAVFLIVAAVASGLPGYAFHALAWTLPGAPPWSVYLVTLCALLCYAAGRPLQAEQRRRRLLHLLPASIAVCAMAAMLAQGLLWIAAPRIAPDVFHIAFIRTLTICAVALALAFCGSRWQRMELSWLAYATLVFVAAKLLFEDLHHGRLEFIAASIFLFALTLIAVPRLARFAQRMHDKA